ncbi:MAG: quinone-dependent dihydroorotate dehydrogenase [Alphaproteobacteria bacterium]|nr:quinone-dependent dihydroorotate dehydrogenase [Alphaproteobacteria bacterium]MBT4085656.1 quinone-dependent dihydroorotate dehydrogenase [Alphaproteobacteria bacterium]MBT4542730.1 quinone-dependent dihydroorotate dehydrogenase [Alphaproteobacteria bacterium]MBT7745864.1 quinone-dependent dihydroorotate dehydrogenase [Alphaproteobacteria bacterium]
MIDLYPLVSPFLKHIDPETAHRLTIRALRTGLVPDQSAPDEQILRIDALGLSFPNPVGLAAGFDKNAEVPDAMLGQGFGFVEIGSVTPLPQYGNPRPRLFRLPEDGAVINRNGFNNEGVEVVTSRLEARSNKRGILGANVGANKDSEDRIADYVTGIQRLAGLSDYITINISSPNTPGLRDLQGKAEMDELLTRCCAARDELAVVDGVRKSLVVKVAPDLDDLGREVIAEAVMTHGIDGLIVSNTTLSRDGLENANKSEVGGMSGIPLFALSTEVLRDMYRLTRGSVILIGAGGIASGADAYAKIRAGASLVQFYTALAYAGPRLVVTIKQELAALLQRDGFSSVADAVGADHT